MSAAPETANISRQTAAGLVAKWHADALPEIIPVRTRAQPKRYNAWNATQKLEWAFNCSIDDIEEVVNWDPNSLDPIRFRAWKEVVLGVFHIGAKFGLQRQRTDDSLALMEVRKRLDRHDKDGLNVGSADPATE